MNEIYKRLRPKSLDDVTGQDKAVKVIRNALKSNNLPHAILLTGPSGVGKTTIARIIGHELGVIDYEKTTQPTDFFEYNASDFRGVDTVREIRSRMGYSGLSKKKTRVYYMDEVHQMTGVAQNAMLKILEDTPNHVYFILSTSEPGKVIKAIHTRCTPIPLQGISDADMNKIVRRAAKKAKIKVKSDRVFRALVEAAQGSARQALVLLETLQGVKNEASQLDLIEKGDDAAPAIAIARALLDTRTQWFNMAKILKDNMIEDVERMRHLVLSYCQTILLSGKSMGRAADIIAAMSPTCYNGKRPEFVGRCYDLVASKK